jgi:uncharacterized membrane protein
MNENKKEKVEGKPFDSKGEKNTGMAVIAYLLFFIPLLTEDKNDPFVKFHVKQGFLIFVSAVIGSILNITIILMPLGVLVIIGTIILAIVGINNALHGKEERLPVLGQFTDKITF